MIFFLSSFYRLLLSYGKKKKKSLRKGGKPPPLSLQKGERLCSPLLLIFNSATRSPPRCLSSSRLSRPRRLFSAPSSTTSLQPSTSSRTSSRHPSQLFSCRRLPIRKPLLLSLRRHLLHGHPCSSSGAISRIAAPGSSSSSPLLLATQAATSSSPLQPLGPFSSSGNDCSSPNDPFSSGAATSSGSRYSLQMLLRHRASLLWRRATSLTGGFFIAMPLLSQVASSSPCHFSCRRPLHHRAASSAVALRDLLTSGRAQLLSCAVLQR